MRIEGEFERGSGVRVSAKIAVSRYLGFFGKFVFSLKI